MTQSASNCGNCPSRTTPADQAGTDDVQNGSVKRRDEGACIRAAFVRHNQTEGFGFRACPWFPWGLGVLVLACFVLAVWVWAQILTIVP